jgi:hypothetical protein
MHWTVWREENILSVPQTAQPLGNHYTHQATQATDVMHNTLKTILRQFIHVEFFNNEKCNFV